MEIEVDSFNYEEIRVRDYNGEVRTHNLGEELKINKHDLNQEMREQSQKYVYYTSLLEKVRADKEASDLRLEKLHADLYEPARFELNKKLGKNPTKDQIESEIMQNEEYLQMRELVNSNEAKVRNLQYVVKAWEQKRDMLIQVSADHRRNQEYEQALKTNQMNSGYQQPSNNSPQGQWN